MPTYYKRFVNDTLTIIPNKASEDNFLEILNQRHSSIKFTMETESNSVPPFLGTQLLNKHTYADTKVYVKPSITGLLLHYKSHVDDRYKSGSLKTMFDRTFRLSSNSVTSLKNVIDWNCSMDLFPHPLSAIDRIPFATFVLPSKDQASADTARRRRSRGSRRPYSLYLLTKRLDDTSNCEKLSRQLWTNSALFTNLYVTCAMQLHTPSASTCWRTQKLFFINWQAFSRQTFLAPKALKKNFSVLMKCTKTNLTVSSMRCFLFTSWDLLRLNVQSDSIRAKVF